jgi:5-methylthioadenosine/S-adenosylhomocysteine deaminase
MSIFDVMRTCAYLQRAVHADPLLMGVPDVLAMATRRGAAALGIDAGVLEPGRKADLILVDAETGFYDPSRPAYRANLRNRLVFASHAGMVCTSIIDGRIVMEDRVMQTVDEDAVAAGARRAVARLIDSLRK